MKTGKHAISSIDSQRAGIALVIVLGFLAILLIMGIGFAVSMRVERIVSRSSLDHVRSRQLGEAALARVVEDIDKSLGDQMSPDWSGDWLQGVYESVAPANGTTFGTNRVDDFLVGHVTNYIPLAIWDQTTNAASFAEWVPFEYHDAGQTKLVGRYAYVIMDCSGFIDVNFDYDPTNNIPRARSFGATPLELQLNRALLREMNSNSAYWDYIFYGRLPNNHPVGFPPSVRPWYRLETIAEFNPLLTRYFANVPPAGGNTNSVNFMAFSEFPQGYMKGSVLTDQAVLPKNIEEIQDREDELKSQFISMGIPDPDVFLNNLRDYMDSDNQPINLNSIGTEAVPMINEAVVSNKFTVTDGIISNEYQALVELWYPFTTANSKSYSVLIRGQYRNADPSGDLDPPILNFTVPVAGPWNYGRFVVVTTPVSRVFSTNIVSFDISDASVRLSIRVLEDGSFPVDQVGQSQSTMIELPVGQSYVGIPGFMRGKAADDPRINWDGSNPIQWREPTAPAQASSYTLGTTNQNLTYDAPDADGHTLMYVANQDLRSVGELGQLLYDATKPWQTISLMDGPNFKPVLDVFRLGTNDIRRGLINPNSQITGVVATVYNNMPVERVPYDPLMFRMNTASAFKLAQQQITNKVAFTNVSDLRWLGTNILNSVANDRAYHESVVANSAGLFSPRQQLFTVVLAAQVLGVNTNVLADQRGVGVIWRDPYPSNGVHRTFVRNFRWLTE